MIAEYKIKINTQDIERAQKVIHQTGGELQKLSQDEVVVKLKYDENKKEINQIIQKLYKTSPKLAVQVEYEMNKEALEKQRKKLNNMALTVDDSALINRIESLSKKYSTMLSNDAPQEQIDKLEKRLADLFATLFEKANGDYNILQKLSEEARNLYEDIPNLADGKPLSIISPEQYEKQANILESLKKKRDDLFKSGAADSSIDKTTASVEDLMDAFSKFAVLNNNTNLSSFWDDIQEKIANGDSRLKSLLTTLGLITSETEELKLVSDGLNNSGGIIGDDNVLLSRKHGKSKGRLNQTLELQKRLMEVKETGIEVARILSVVYDEASDTFLELQEKAPGNILGSVYEQTDNEFVNIDLYKATDQQILKLIQDLAKLHELGLGVDINPSNIFYDEKKGFSFIDLDLDPAQFKSNLEFIEDAKSGIIGAIEDYYKRVDDSVGTQRIQELSQKFDKFFNAIIDQLGGESAFDSSAIQTVLANLQVVGEQAGEAIIDGLRTGVDAHSNSKKAESVVDDVANGIVDEFEARTDDMQKAAQKSADAIAESFGERLKNGFDELDEVYAKEVESRDSMYGYDTPQNNLLSGTTTPSQQFDNEVQQNLVMLENYKNTIAEIDRLKLEPETDETKAKLEELNKLADYFVSKITVIRSENGGEVNTSMMLGWGASGGWSERLKRDYSEEQRKDFLNVAKDRTGLQISKVASEFHGISDEISNIEAKSEGLRNALTKDLTESSAYVSKLRAAYLGIAEANDELKTAKPGSEDFKDYTEQLNTFLSKYPELEKFKDALGYYDKAPEFVKSDEWLDFLATLPQAHTYLESIGYDFDKINRASNETPVLFQESDGQISMFKEIANAKREDAKATEELIDAEKRLSDIPGQMSIFDFINKEPDEKLDNVKATETETTTKLQERNKLVNVYIDLLKEEIKYEAELESLRSRSGDQSSAIAVIENNLESIREEKQLYSDLQLTKEEDLRKTNALEKAKREASAKAVKALQDEAKQTEALMKKRTSLAQSMIQWLSSNPIAEKKYGPSLREDIDELNSSASLTGERINQIEDGFKRVKTAAIEAGETGKSLMNMFHQRFKSLITYLGTFVSFYRIIGTARSAITTIIELDTQLVDLRKTTKMNNEELERFYKNSSNIAKQLGVTTSEIISQAAAWSRLGYSTEQEATRMAELSSQFTSISPGMTTDNATDYLISTMQAYGIAVDDVQRKIMDNVNRIGKILPKHMVTYGVKLLT